LCNAEASEHKLAENYNISSVSLLEKAEIINEAIKNKFQ